jgi:hypothetical protein
MNWRFDWTPSHLDVDFQVVGPDGVLSVDRWALDAPDHLMPGIETLRKLASLDRAIEGEASIVVEAEAIARLGRREAAALGLPALTDAVAKVEPRGLITSPAFRVDLQWLTPLGQPMVGVERLGAFLKTGQQLRRLPDSLFDIVEAIDRFAAAAPEDTGQRLAALAALREVLPKAQEAGTADTRGPLAAMTIAVADAFSLDLRGDARNPLLVPILHRLNGDAPLLDPVEQEQFGDHQFGSFREARSVYTLGSNRYLVIQPELKRALSVVRRMQDEPASRRRQFAANPAPFLREALGDDAETLVETVFREAPGYSERVIGLGLWQPRILPWVKQAGNDWFGPGDGAEPDTQRVDGPRATGLQIGDRILPLSEDEAAELQRCIEAAMAAGEQTVTVETTDGAMAVPASPATLKAITELARLRGSRERPRERIEREVVLIETNENDEDYSSSVVATRPAPARGMPSMLRTPPKEHQNRGIAWLQNAWTAGMPGVLLADDMGLGKTLQGLAFLAWLREGMRTGTIPAGPLLIVAPTGLLNNWLAEHDMHLAAPGLGACVEAFGRGLALLKRKIDDRPALDPDLLRRADWVLTTYETLRDYDRDFGQVRFAAVLFDEAQKIKTPGIRLTDAAKAVNADFRVAMTGTPIENRLSDLWCIVDTVFPGWLKDLKSFSAEYERNIDTVKLASLKKLLETSLGQRPRLMMRRLKEQELPDLPPISFRTVRRAMPAPQKEAYEQAVRAARTANTPGAVLSALHKLRDISLHPDPHAEVSDEAFIAQSGRLIETVRILDECAARGESALIFLYDRDMQARLAGLFQRRYGLARAPEIINGTVAGHRRQAFVDAFQIGEGFNLMILSPHAGGVGLTLTRANHVIHLFRWWNPAVEDQSTGRVYRIGQKLGVTVHLPLAIWDKGPSFDENLDRLIARKRRLMQDALVPPDAMEAADRDELFRTTVGT